MIKLLCLLALLPLWCYAVGEELSPNGPATPTITTETVHEEKVFNPRASHWLTALGVEQMQYDVPWSFQGVKKNIKPSQQNILGGRLGLGGEVYLGHGFMTATKFEGYFQGTLFTRSLTADPQLVDINVAFTKRTGNVWGGDVVQSFSYLFDMKTKNPFMDEMTYLTAEPFIEAGLGVASAYNRIRYHYDTGPAGTQEDYQLKMVDQILNTKIAAGINFTSTSGYFLYLKATQNRFDVTKRTITEKSMHNGGPLIQNDPVVTRNINLTPIMIYSLGGGYKF